MSSTIEIRLLNPLNVQFGYNTDLLRDIDDLMLMAECRFYSALVAIHAEKSNSEKKVMQKILQREVVSVILLFRH